MLKEVAQVYRVSNVKHISIYKSLVASKYMLLVP